MDGQNSYLGTVARRVPYILTPTGTSGQIKGQSRSTHKFGFNQCSSLHQKLVYPGTAGSRLRILLSILPIPPIFGFLLVNRSSIDITIRGSSCIAFIPGYGVHSTQYETRHSHRDVAGSFSLILTHTHRVIRLVTARKNKDCHRCQSLLFVIRSPFV